MNIENLKKELEEINQEECTCKIASISFQANGHSMGVCRCERCKLIENLIEILNKDKDKKIKDETNRLRKIWESKKEVSKISKIHFSTKDKKYLCHVGSISKNNLKHSTNIDNVTCAKCLSIYSRSHK